MLSLHLLKLIIQYAFYKWFGIVNQLRLLSTYFDFWNLKSYKARTLEVEGEVRNNDRAPDDFGFFLDICEGVAFPIGLLASSETHPWWWHKTRRDGWKEVILSFILLTKWPLEGEKSQDQVSHGVTLC